MFSDIPQDTTFEEREEAALTNTSWKHVLLRSSIVAGLVLFRVMLMPKLRPMAAKHPLFFIVLLFVLTFAIFTIMIDFIPDFHKSFINGLGTGVGMMLWNITS